MIKIKVNDQTANQRIDNFLNKKFPQLSKPTIYKLIRNKKIKVNDKKIDFNYRLNLNDEISIYFVLNTQPTNNSNYAYVKNQLMILYEDENVLVVHKQPGLLCQPESEVNPKEILINHVLSYLKDKGEFDFDNHEFIPCLVHRLDRNTEGIVVVAKTHHASIELNDAFKEHYLTKKYLALAHGPIHIHHRMRIELFITDLKNGLVKVSSEQTLGSKRAITFVDEIKQIKGKYSLLEIEIITGRKHQIRASLYFMNWPIVGDPKYRNKFYDKDPNFKYQCLCAYYLKFKFPKNMKLSYLNKYTFKIDEPEFMKILKIK